MRAALLAALAFLAAPLAAGSAEARPLHVRVHGGLAPAAAILVHEGILTPQQLACAELRRGPLGSRRVEHVSVFERHDGACPGTPQPPTFLFDVYVDTVSGVVDYTPDDRNELQTIVPLPRGRLID